MTGVLGELGVGVLKEGDLGGLNSETVGEMGGDGKRGSSGEVGSFVLAASMEGLVGDSLGTAGGAGDETGCSGDTLGASGRLCSGM